MLSVVDETEDDWQAITALGSWAEFDAFFAEKYIDSECFGGDVHVERRPRSTPPSTSIASESEPYVCTCTMWCACAYNQK